MKELISIKNLGYSYYDIPALNNVTFNVAEGDSVAVIGPNGSGKSTLLKIMNGIIFANRGEYVFRRQNITEKYMSNNSASRNFHKSIGFVFQNPEVQLFCPSVYEEVAFGPMQMGLDDKTVRSAVERYLELLNIEHLAQRVPYHLSEGEKKKVAIASVLAIEPDVLTLDEPMDGLDPKTKKFIRDLIIKLNHSGKTIICATHDFEYVKDVFKRAIVLSEDKTLAFDGSYDEAIAERVMREF
jgi:cobalt/nickel transport system ATP-binding protein